MIRRGEPWGHETIVPPDFSTADSDSALARFDSSTPIHISGGDIARSIGNPSRPVIGGSGTEISIDAMRCIVRGTNSHQETRLAASCVVVGNFWRGRHIIVSNAGWIGDANISPRAHPNDGVVEEMTLSPSMSLRQRILAHQKIRTGTHIPHPDITVSRKKVVEVVRIKREKLNIDGHRVENWSSVSIEVIPDYWRVLL